jgi:hypothetical protein
MRKPHSAPLEMPCQWQLQHQAVEQSCPAEVAPDCTVQFDVHVPLCACTRSSRTASASTFRYGSAPADVALQLLQSWLLPSVDQVASLARCYVAIGAQRRHHRCHTAQPHRQFAALMCMAWPVMHHKLHSNAPAGTVVRGSPLGWLPFIHGASPHSPIHCYISSSCSHPQQN